MSELNENIQSRLIFSPRIARHLLKMGNRIIDIKADRENQQRTIFVFEKTEKLGRDFDTIINDMADERMKKKAEETEAKE